MKSLCENTVPVNGRPRRLRVDSQLRLDVGDLKLGGRRFAPADSL